MIGRKKLSQIRHDLQRALAATGEDPIRWLEDRVSASKSNGRAGQEKSEVLHSLQRFLNTPSPRKRKPQRAGAKK